MIARGCQATPVPGWHYVDGCWTPPWLFQPTLHPAAPVNPLVAAAHAVADQTNAPGWIILAVLVVIGVAWLYRKLKG